MSGFHNSLGRIPIGDKSIATVDVVLTVAAGLVISKVFNVNPILAVIGVTASGIVVHKVIGQETPLNTMIGLGDSDSDSDDDST